MQFKRVMLFACIALSATIYVSSQSIQPITRKPVKNCTKSIDCNGGECCYNGYCRRDRCKCGEVTCRASQSCSPFMGNDYCSEYLFQISSSGDSTTSKPQCRKSSDCRGGECCVNDKCVEGRCACDELNCTPSQMCQHEDVMIGTIQAFFSDCVNDISTTSVPVQDITTSKPQCEINENCKGYECCIEGKCIPDGDCFCGSNNRCEPYQYCGYSNSCDNYNTCKSIPTCKLRNNPSNLVKAGKSHFY